MSAAEQPDLLFFDTFSHDTSEELNLDLVQFPKSVYVREIRIIPLGARVEGDFPGGVRLGATNPTKFHIDFFVNDLSKPGASTFEALGSINYCQNGQIHMECGKTVDTPRIPTDGLVLRGWYTTITLAVYGNLTQVLSDTPIGANPPSTIPPPVIAREAVPIPIATVAPADWIQEAVNPIPAYTGNVAASIPDAYGPTNYPPENYDNQMYRSDYYAAEPPKDPRTYIEGSEWEKDRRDLSSERDPARLRHTPRSIELDRERERRDGRSRRRSLERARSRESSRLRDRSRELDRVDRIHSRSRSRERDYLIKGEYRPLSRSRSRSIDRERLRSHSNERDWERGSYKKDDYRRHRDASYERSRGGSYEPRSPYDKRAPSYERKASYEKRGPSYEKRLSPYDKRSSSYERRAPSYEKNPSYDRRRHSPYSRVRSSSYGSRSPSRDDPRRRPRSPPAESARRPVSPRDAEVASPINSIRSGDAEEYERSGKQIPRVDFYHPSYRHEASIRSPSQEIENAFVDKPHSTLVTVPIVDNPPAPKEIESPPPRNADEDRSIEAEEFEPILSDEDICDDLEGSSYMEVDYDVNEYCAVDDIIKYYNPYKSEWVKYEYVNKIGVEASVRKEGVKDVFTASFEELCDASPELFKISEMTEAAKKMEQKFHTNTFIEIDNVIREEWVHQCEQLFLTFTNLANSTDIVMRIFCDHQKYSDPEDFFDIYNYLITFCRIGLNFEFALAQQQPTYKIRHIKCGVRLAESLMSHKHNGQVMSMMLDMGLDLPMLLLEMYSKEYMALSIRLMILKALNACLASKEAVKHFMKERVFPKFDKKDTSNERKLKNGYQALISIMETNPLGRIKFSISALIKKLNIYELLSKLRELVLEYNKTASENKNDEDPEFSEKDVDFIVRAFEEIIFMYRNQCFHLSQPKRFLPVAAQFEISKECSNEILLQFFKTHQILEVCLYLLTCPTTCSNLVIISPIHDLIHELVYSQDGLNFLYDNLEMSELLFKTLAQHYGQQNADEFLYPHDLSSYSELQILGFELAYRLKALYYIKAIFDHQAGKVEENELIDRLQALYCLTFGNIGKTAVPDVIVMGDHAECLMSVFEADLRARPKGDPPGKHKSPAKGYAIELIVAAVRLSADVPFLKRYGARLLKAAAEHERFEPSVSSVLQEAVPYLKPAERPALLAGEDLAACVDMVKAATEHAADLPGELTTCLRVLLHYCVAQRERDVPLAAEPAPPDYAELKYKYNALQLFSLDGVAVLSGVLAALTARGAGAGEGGLAGARGLQLAQLLRPALRLLDELLARAVRARGAAFRDTSAAPLLLRAYGLARAFPAGAAAARPAARAAEAAVKALLAYAQPCADDAGDGDSIRRGPWTALCAEVIAYTTSAPHTFVAGLAVFSELLPLPLPLQARAAPSARELADAANERRMWSAHLHALAGELGAMLQAICVSTSRPVVHMLRRVCVQVADLAPNTAGVVARAAAAAVARELAPPEPAGATAARVLGFLACLVSHAPVKCAVLQAMRGAAPAANGAPGVAGALCDVLSTAGGTAEHAAAQEFAAAALAALCDVEVALTPPAAAPEQLWADALPTRAALDALLGAACACAGAARGAAAAAALRALFVAAETEAGLAALRRASAKKRGALGGLARWAGAAAAAGEPAALEAAALLAELARALREEGAAGGAAGRRGALAARELQELLAVDPTDKDHPVLALPQLLKERNADEEVIANATFLVEQLSSPSPDGTTTAITEPPELSLPEPTPLVAQFAARQVSAAGHASDERLTAAYWLNVPIDSHDDDVSDSDLVWCDIASVASEVAGTRTALAPPATDRRPHVCVALARVRGEGGAAALAGGADAFRSRPPNTSRPPSLHVDDFTALHQPYAHAHSHNHARGISGTRRRFPPAAHHYRQLRSRGAWEGGHFGHVPPAHYMMGSMGWAGARMQRGPRHRTFMR